jgi:hypothetical protein
MRQFQSISYFEEITCVKCGAPMWLTRIERDEPGSARHRALNTENREEAASQTVARCVLP